MPRPLAQQRMTSQCVTGMAVSASRAVSAVAKLLAIIITYNAVFDTGTEL